MISLTCRLLGPAFVQQPAGSIIRGRTNPLKANPIFRQICPSRILLMDPTLRGLTAVSRRQASNFSRDNQRGPKPGRKKPGDALAQAIRNCGADWQKALLVLRESENPTLRIFNEAIGVLDELLELDLKPTCATFNRVMEASANTGN